MHLIGHPCNSFLRFFILGVGNYSIMECLVGNGLT